MSYDQGEPLNPYAATSTIEASDMVAATRTYGGTRAARFFRILLSCCRHLQRDAIWIAGLGEQASDIDDSDVTGVFRCADVDCCVAHHQHRVQPVVVCGNAHTDL